VIARQERGKLLAPQEFDRIIDTIPRVGDRARMHQHDALVRDGVAKIEEAAPPALELADVVRWIREEVCAGREGTVRGKTMLALADRMEEKFGIAGQR